MMVAVFAAMTLALICGWFGSRTLAVALFFWLPSLVDRAFPVSFFITLVRIPDALDPDRNQRHAAGALMIDSHRPMTTQPFSLR